MITRRGLLAGILGACAAPAIIHNPMRLWVPRSTVSGIWSSELLVRKFWEATEFGANVERDFEAMDYWKREADSLCGIPKIAIDPAWPGGDHSALIKWSQERGQMTIIRRIEIQPRRA